RIDRLPPHSIEAEQGALGCILLAPNDCLGECIEKLKSGPEVFYDLRHQMIFQTLVEMFQNGGTGGASGIDLITLQQKLRDAQQLENVGGLAYLSSLPDKAPSGAHLSYYLDIIQEKFLLRKMIQVCGGIIGRVHEYEGAVEALLDEVERDILKIAEERISGVALTIKELVHRAISKIEE